MKVALVHYWLVSMRGGEKVLDALCRMYPQADVYTHVYDAEQVTLNVPQAQIHTTFIDCLPFSKRLYQKYLPLMPLALEQLDLRGYDLVISSESGPAKGVITGPDCLHVCYCHSPMRYVWDLYPEYMEHSGWLTRMLAAPVAHYVRNWDANTAQRVDRFVANSSFVARRIRKLYRRDADVVPPPVAVNDFTPGGQTGDFYLLAGQLVPYKRPDLAVAAFNRLGRRLVVVGEGELAKKLQRLAGPNIELRGHTPFDELRELYRTCRALVFPGIEDFGIVPVEAMASGRPVIAYGRGGALDSVAPGVSGLLFGEQTEQELIHAVLEFERDEQRFDPATVRAHAMQFGEAQFHERMRTLIERYRDQF